MRSTELDSSSIGDRMREIQRDRLAVIAGCQCPPDPYSGVTNHRDGCPLHPGLPPATPPMSSAALSILADHRRAIADYYQKCEMLRANGTFAK